MSFSKVVAVVIWLLLLGFLCLFVVCVPAETALGQGVTSQPSLRKLFKAISAVESSGNPKAHNPKEDARGIVQIRLVMVNDCNRIAKKKRWTHDDAWDTEKSFQMFQTYLMHYYPNGTYEQWARAWNGGPDGPKKRSTVKYWGRVKKHL